MELASSFETAGIGHNNGPALAPAPLAIAADFDRPHKRILASAVAEISADGMGITTSGRYFDARSTRFTATPNPVIR